MSPCDIQDKTDCRNVNNYEGGSNWKVKAKFSLFAYDMIILAPKNSTRELLQLQETSSVMW